MFKNSLLAIIILAVTACAPSPVQLTSTANFAIAETETAAPTATYTPSPTLTPTSTPTETPIPTPLGGGDGILIYSQYFAGNIYQVNSDGSGLKEILSRPEIESIIGSEYQEVVYQSYSGYNYLIIDGDLYELTDEWQLVSKVDLNVGDIYVYTISPDGRYFVYETINRDKFISSLDGLGTRLLFGANDRFIGISADSTTIYYTRDFGREMWAVNSDGSNKRKLNLESLKSSTPYEDISLPEGTIIISRPQRIDTIAISQDKKQVAFTWFDLLFVADAADLEFSNPRLVTKLPESAHTLVWSPNGEYLLVGLYFCANSSCNPGDAIVVNVMQNKVEREFSSTEYKNATLCGFSPDSKQIIFSFFSDSLFRLVEKDGQSSIDIRTQWPYSCPVWQ